MNSIMETVVLAGRGRGGPKAREAEARYLAARNAFGTGSAEAQGAMTYWVGLEKGRGGAGRCPTSVR